MSANPLHRTETYKFDSNIAGASREHMDAAVAALVDTVTDDEDRFQFEQEMNRFKHLFERYSTERGKRLDWDLIEPPREGLILDYQSLPADVSEEEVRDALSKVAVVKLNGGLGTTMGCVGPKSAIEVREGQTFLDLIVRQIEFLNTEYGTDVPLVLMNSFNTHRDTQAIIHKYENLEHVNILSFNQSRFPRIMSETMLPVPEVYESENTQWYPPGHGDIYASLHRSGVLQKLIDAGKEFIFISNVDNLGATIDVNILTHLVSKGDCEFALELTNKTKADVKGGTLIQYEGQTKLLEIAQVPANHVKDFKSIKKFKVFNTNNMWVSTHAIKRTIEEGTLNMDVIVNNKTWQGHKVIQLEQACGAAIESFSGAIGINVPRSRFLPVKRTSDLFMVQSNLFDLDRGTLTLSEHRLGGPPVIKLGKEFSKMTGYQSRFPNIPDILELDHLTVNGDVVFGANMTLKGTVVVVANQGSHIDLADGSILEDVVVSGNIHVVDL